MPKAIRDKVGAQGWEDNVPCLFTALKVVSGGQSLPGEEMERPRPPQPWLWSFRPEAPRATARGWVPRGPAEPPCLGGRHPWRKDGRAGSCPPLSSPTDATWCWSSQARRGWEEEGLQAPGTHPRPPTKPTVSPRSTPVASPTSIPVPGWTGQLPSPPSCPSPPLGLRPGT